MGKMSLQSFMRTVAVACLFLFGVASASLGASPVVHHDLVVTLYPEAQRLTGTDTVKFAPSGAALVTFALAPGARIINVSMDEKASPFTFEGGGLHIPLPSNGRRGEINVAVSYEAFFRDAVPEDPVHTEDPSYGVTGVISSEGTFLLPGAGWYPALHDSMATFRLQVQAPAGYKAVTAGRRLAQGTRAGVSTCVWEIKRALHGLSLSAGPYVVRERDVQGLAVYTYFFPEDDHLAERYLEKTANYLNLYMDLLGPYPFDKFAVVENFFPTGYGFRSYTLLGRTVLRLPFILETSLGHEVAHAWWGNGVLVDYEHGNWCEGLTTYVADHLYKERSSAEEGRAYRLNVLRDYATLVPQKEDLPLEAFTHRFSPSTRSVGYGKGAMVFHMARRLVGDEAFWEGLKAVFREKCFQRASWDDFAMALGRSSGDDLKAFFRQWVTRPGAPRLALGDVEAKADRQGWTVTGILTQQRPYYDLEVSLRLETDGDKIETRISSTGRKAFFTLRSDTRPGRLVVDPNVDLFRRLDPSEVPPTVNGIKGSKSLVAVVARSLPPKSRDLFSRLLEGLGQNKTPLLLEDEATPLRLKGHDVLYLGVPGGKATLGTLPEGLVISPDRFTLNGVTYDAPEDALFTVLAHPQGGDRRLVGLFLPLSAKAVPRAAGKIPHYGKYSYLVFRKGINEAKGTWPAATSPLVHKFTYQGISSP
jgi:aminopeptidase N